VDVRGCYCALASCEMLGLDKAAVAAACGMIDYIRRCQVRPRRFTTTL
jgi:prenyltransferase beta subunit